MPGNGDKADGNFTKKEKWMIGVYIVTAVTSTLLFVIMLVMIFQLQTSINASQSSSSAQSGQPLNRTTEIESLQKMLEDVERKLGNMENKQAQTDDLQNKFEEMEKKLTNMENKMRTAEERSNRRAALLLDSWYEATNGLLYKLFSSKETFADAWANCQQRGARLISTGLKSTSSAIDDLWRYTPANELFWIGLNKSSGNFQWIWSDEEPYNKKQWSYSGSAPTTSQKRCALMQWNNSPTVNYRDYCTSIHGYICETE